MKEKLKNLLRVQRLNRLPSDKVRRHQWVFSSTENRHFDSNSRHLFLYVYRNMPEITPLYVMNDPDKRRRLQEKYPRARIVDTNTSEGIAAVMESGVWFTSAGLPVYGIGLAKTHVIVNLWHGIPLKKIVLAEKRKPLLKWLLYRMIFPLIFSRNYTWVVTTSSHLIPIMQESFKVTKEQMKVWGQPRNDNLFRSRKAQDVLGAVYQEFSQLPQFTKAVLYAPTHREGKAVRLFPFKDFEEKKLAEFLEREKILLCVRTHVYEKSLAALPDSRRILWLNEDRAEDIMDVLDVFDLLITDYSSIYIDFLLTGKPMLFLPYDKEEYLALRGFNFPYGKVTPGPKPKTFEDFCGQLQKLLAGEDVYRERRRKADQYFNQVHEPCCGQICAKVQEHLL